MSAGITTLFQAVGVEGLTKVSMTDPEQDADTGDWVREVRLYRHEGDVANASLIFTVKMSADTRAALLFVGSTQV